MYVCVRLVSVVGLSLFFRSTNIHISLAQLHLSTLSVFLSPTHVHTYSVQHSKHFRRDSVRDPVRRSRCGKEFWWPFYLMPLSYSICATHCAICESENGLQNCFTGNQIRLKVKKANLYFAFGLITRRQLLRWYHLGLFFHTAATNQPPFNVIQYSSICKLCP